MKLTLKQLDYHRNGIAGCGFHVAIVRDETENLDMLIIRFPHKHDNEIGVACAAFDLAKLDARDIRFFYNSFRGDNYATEIDKLIVQHDGGMHAPYEVPTEELEASS